jgi:CheY-like chemotaxis protein
VGATVSSLAGSGLVLVNNGEDDTFIAMELETLVEGLGHRVLGVARTHAEALALTRKKRPGLILADIQLADGSSGLEAVNELLSSFEAPVIFITAYPERFLTGERPEPAFLIANHSSRQPFRRGQPSLLRAQREETRAPRAGLTLASFDMRTFVARIHVTCCNEGMDGRKTSPASGSTNAAESITRSGFRHLLPPPLRQAAGARPRR